MKYTLLLLFYFFNTSLLVAQQAKKESVPFLDSNGIQLSGVKVPTIFTPNGDNINDVLKIEHRLLASISCKIYSRWGVLIAEINAPNQVWDGYTTSGVRCSSGTYFYVLTAKGVDNIDHNLKGFIELMR